jgi:hypothetical protein
MSRALRSRRSKRNTDRKTARPALFDPAVFLETTEAPGDSRHQLALSTTALLSVGVAFPGVALAQKKSLKEQITGKWTLVSNGSVAPGATRCGGELQQSPADNDRAL